MMGKIDIRRLTLHQLRVFLAVARRRSFTRAAEDLLITQSAVSAQIRELKTLLGVPLFDQVGKKIHITAAGRLLEEQAGRIEGVVDEIDRLFMDWREGGAGLVRVGGSTSIGIYYLPSLIAAFRNGHPGIEVSLEIENTAHLEERLLRNDYEVVFVGGALSAKEIESEPFIEDEIFFAAAPSHPLTGSGSLAPGKLTDHRTFVREPGSATRRAMEECCRDRGVVFGDVVQLGSVEAIKQAVMAGLGISYFSSLTVRHEIATRRLVRIKVRGLKVRRTFYLASLRSKRTTPALESFKSFVQKYPSFQ